MKFRKTSYSMRGLIWLTAVSLVLTTCFIGSIETHGGELPGYVILMGVVSVLSFIWAVWSSVPPEN